MKVHELIEQLSDYDPEKEVVFISDNDGFCVANDIKTILETTNRISLI